MRWCLIAVSVLVSIVTAGTQLREGKFASDRAKPQEPQWRSESMDPVVAERRGLIPLSLTDADRVWMKDIRWQGQASKRKAAIVERPGGKYFFILDTNGNG